MRVSLAAGLIGAFLASGIVSADARDWNRSGTTVGPRGGTTTLSVNGQCGNGSCSRQATRTGPRGQTLSRAGSVTRTAPGTFQGSRTTTGPRGRSVTRSGTTTVQ